MGSGRMKKVTAVVGVSAILLSGCGLFGPSEETSKIDPPQQTAVEFDPNVITPPGGLQPVPEIPASGEATVQTTAHYTVYLLDANGFVVPVMLSLPKEEGPAKQVLAYMVKGGPVQQLLPQGFHAILPEGTKVLGMSIKEGTATVDFSKEFTKYDPRDEQKIVDAVTRSLTEFGNIKNVTIWVNGTPLTEMPVDKTPISMLQRSNGVNLELAEGTIPGRSTPVTIYFQAQLNEKLTYYVPVTRLIPQTEDKAKAVVEEFIKGPREGSPLFNSLLSTTRVLGVEQKNGTVVVNLSEEALSYDKGKEANPEALQALVLSVAESTGNQQVQIKVEGKPLARAGELDFSKPVVRPREINATLF
ncbi:MAG: GerMN domain-containing protein [Clostridia bacterium]